MSDMPASPGRTRVLLLCQDLVGEQMAGSGIRAWSLARALSAECAVTLAAPMHRVPTHAKFRLAPVTLDRPTEIDGLLAEADVVISNGNMLHDYPQLADLPVPWAVDAYVPTPTEALAANQHRNAAERRAGHLADTDTVYRFLHRADFVVCASERQRDLYIGFLAAAGRLNPDVFDDDPTLRRLIDVVPYGLSSEPPLRHGAIARGGLPGIGADDRLILWGGGIWNWFDPLTLLQALVQVVREWPDVRLLFPGTRHPFVERIPDMEMRAEAVALSERLGLGDHVLFGEWTAYADRANYLLDAEVGVSLHPAGIEARYAFRTRLLDYIWAGLPMVVTEGDALAEIVAQHDLGIVVPPGDVSAVSEALRALLADPQARARRRDAFAAVAAGLTWDVVAAPLVAFCQAPHFAADRRAGSVPEPLVDSAGADLRRRLAEAEDRVAALDEQIAAYERGRFMRAMAVLKRWRGPLGLGGARQ
jgi:glycosyltransferase involved in cell wall biosynthesis